jgi:beta-lactamase class D
MPTTPRPGTDPSPKCGIFRIMHRIRLSAWGRGGRAAALPAVALLAACGPAQAELVHEPVAALPPAATALAAAFAAEEAHGTILIRRLSDGREWVHHAARADSAYLPASTFKIPNAAIALETGAVAGPDEEFAWDGVRRWAEGWNRDHTLRSSMPASAVPVYQELARRIGAERMRGWLERLDYGNADIGGGIDQFWLSGALRTSAREQVGFLERFVDGRTPFSARTMAQMREILRTDGGAGWSLYSKTGWAFDEQLGWWVGWTEHGAERYVFALNIDMPDTRHDPPKRIRIGRAALAAVGALP